MRTSQLLSATFWPSHIARIEAKLDYWREDPMLHAFHCMLHHAWYVDSWENQSHFAFFFRTAISDTKGQYSRIYETFWFSHGQFLKRWQARCEQCSWSLHVKVLNRARSTSNAFCGSSWFWEAKRRPWAWLHCGILWVWFQSWKQVEHIIGLFMFFFLLKGRQLYFEA